MNTQRCKVKALVVSCALFALLGFSLLAWGSDLGLYGDAGGFVQIAAVGETALYVKFEGLDGEVQGPQYSGWSELLAFEQGQRNGASAAGVGPRLGSVVFDDIVLTKAIDKTGPKLAEAVCTSSVYPRVEIHATRAFVDGRKTFYAYEFRNVRLTSYRITGSAQSDMLPVEKITLIVDEIKATYTEYDESGRTKGNVEYSWRVDEDRLLF